MTLPEFLVLFMRVWGGIGAAVAVLFLTIGIDRVDEDARGTYLFRLLLVPGILLIWPLVLWRWWQIESKAASWLPRYQPLRASYGPAVWMMSIAILCFALAGLSVRQEWPSDVAPVQLEAGQ